MSWSEACGTYPQKQLLKQDHYISHGGQSDVIINFKQLNHQRIDKYIWRINHYDCIFHQHSVQHYQLIKVLA